MKFPHTTLRGVVVAATMLAVCVATVYAKDVNVTRLWTLSDFNGPIRHDAGRIEIDRDHDEAIWLIANRARVFNANGMEVFAFEMPVEGVVDIATFDASEMLALTIDPSTGGFALVRIDFRGRLLDAIEIGAFPAEFSDFVPNQIESRGDRLYLINTSQSRVVILDSDGDFVDGIDLTRYVDNSENVRGTPELGGFAVTDDGTMAFTVPLVDGAYLLTPGGEIRAWGRGGSNPGSFGIAGAIAIDDSHRTYVLDKLRRVILCFDEDQTFVGEFSGRDRAGNSALVFPQGISVDARGRLYVSQMGMQGAAVFAADWE